MSYQELLSHFPQPGAVIWIGIRPARRVPMESLSEVLLDAASGLPGDHYTGRSNRKRQITLVQQEHLTVIARLLNTVIAPETLRRNIVVSGINLLALKGQYIRVGEAILEITGACHPCSRMEAALGHGGYNVMRGHGGMTASIHQGGWVRTGDRVEWIHPDHPA